jgi:hypothetical protein
VTKENKVLKPAYVDKTMVLAVLRSRQLHARADWVDRELPGLIDIHKNSALLHMLSIDLDAMASGDVASGDMASGDVASVDAAPADSVVSQS